MNREGLVRMSRRQRKSVKRQKRDRTWGYVRIVVIRLVSVFLLTVASVLALFGYTYDGLREPARA
jgi:membrane-anchored glycerophosphoryl diester phosphodiesterase (GDPDase)